MIAGNRASLNVIFSASKLILGFMTLDLPSLQCPEADLGSWGMSSSEPPSLDSVVALIQSLSPFRPVHFDCDLPRNMGLFDALLHESRCASNQSSVRCSNTCVVTSSGDIAEECGDSISPVGHSAASVFSGNKHDDMILAKLESIYTDSGDHGSSMIVLNMKQGRPAMLEWLGFNRVNGRARKGMEPGPVRVLIRLSGGHVVGSFSTREEFSIGGTNSVRVYEEGVVDSGRSYVVGSGEVSFPMGAVVFSNILTTIFPTYAHEVRTAEREFEGIAKHFENYPQVRLILKYDEALSHSIHTASDMFIIPSVFELCGLTQMIAMRKGAVPIARRTGGLNDNVFDVDEDTIPLQSHNGFTFLTPDEQSAAMLWKGHSITSYYTKESKAQNLLKLLT